MANKLYPLGKTHFAKGDIIWKASGGSTIKAILVDTGTYTYNDAHEFFSSLSGVKGNSGGTTYTDGGTLTLIDAAASGAAGGICDANDVTLTAVTTGNNYEAVVIYKQGTSAADSILLAYIDTFGSGMPVTPNGGDIVIQWDNGANKIFVL